MIESWLKIVRDHPLRPTAMQRHVLTMLAIRMDWATGCGFASTEQLRADADASKSTVWRATTWARGEALLVQTRRGHNIGNGRKIASEWQLTQGFTGETLATQGFNGSDPRFQSGVPKVSAQDHHQDLSTSKSSSSRARAAAIISQALPGATDSEIETILTRIKERRPRDLVAYVTTLARNGDLIEADEPCDTDGEQAHSQACRHGDSYGCTAKWCKCRCHDGAAA